MTAGSSRGPEPRIVPVPQLSDNYAYLVIHPSTGDAIVVDPAETEPLLEAAAREGATIRAILNTHHHYDHCQANAELKQATGARVYGSAVDAERLPALDEPLAPGTAVEIAGLGVSVVLVPGHTTGHVGYRIGANVFTGDTLFVAGCGRLFEGTAADMHRSLCQVLAELPRETRVWCGHEYTEKNLAFAATLEPGNAALAARIEQARAQRARGEPTVPSTIGDELAFNPFLRVTSSELVASVRRQRPDVHGDDPVSVLAAVRALKDAY